MPRHTACMRGARAEGGAAPPGGLRRPTDDLTDGGRPPAASRGPAEWGSVSAPPVVARGFCPVFPGNPQWHGPLTPPVLDALAAYHAQKQTPFTPPGHKQGRGTDPRVRAVLGDAVFRSDVLATSGLDDRTSSRGVLAKAQELMADAVGAEHTFFST
ncbi:hypothetical protein GCM10010353_37740 [Streptomyces chryseus]|nr:hypothetical protein GCM10010353_37740 [Streptomyces chryseus]